METKKALREFKGKKGDGFNFMEREKANRFAKITKDRKKKIEERQGRYKLSEADETALRARLEKVMGDKKMGSINTFDLLQTVKSAEKVKPQDRGVRNLRILLEKKWQKKEAELDPSQIADIKSYYSRTFPSSFVNDLFAVQPMHGTPEGAGYDYGQVTTPPDPMHKKIFKLQTKIAAYPDGEEEPVELEAGTVVKVCGDMEVVENDSFANPIVFESGQDIFVTERDVLETASRKTLSPEDTAKKIAELFVKHPKAKHQIDIVASEESGFDVEIIRRAQKFGLNKDTRLFLAEWENWKKESLRELAPTPKSPTDMTSEEEDQPASEMESKAQTEDNATPKNPTDMTSEEEDQPSSNMQSGNKVAQDEEEDEKDEDEKEAKVAQDEEEDEKEEEEKEAKCKAGEDEDEFEKEDDDAPKEQIIEGKKALSPREQAKKQRRK